jgi:hypothetical protein
VVSGREDLALLARITGGPKNASLMAVRHSAQDFSCGRGWLGHSIAVLETWGRCPCQIAWRISLPGGLLILDIYSTCRNMRHKLSR